MERSGPRAATTPGEAAPPLSGRIALVTGAAVRLGRAIALGLARDGADVVLHYRRSAGEAEAAAAAIRALGRRAWPLDADLAEPGAAEELADRAAAAAGAPPSILVNNASSFPPDDFETFGSADLDRSIRVNAWAPLALARRLVAIGRGGSIVNLLDTRVDGYDWLHVSYHAAKTLLELFTRMMAVRFAPAWRVNGVSPGLVLAPVDAPPGYLEARAGELPLGRPGTAEDVAAAVAYLCRAEYTTGEVIRVDGGRHLREADRG
jgi:NAD(P)-dependent dehydrogenase (short-subunit alcohol dehydrogenase family)